MSIVHLFRLEWGHRQFSKGGASWFGVTHKIADNHVTALALTIAGSPAHLTEALLDITTIGNRKDIDPYCIKLLSCEQCMGKFGNDQSLCRDSLYMFNDRYYISVIEVSTPGYKLVKEEVL